MLSDLTQTSIWSAADGRCLQGDGKKSKLLSVIIDTTTHIRTDASVTSSLVSQCQMSAQVSESPGNRLDTLTVAKMM